MKNIIVEREIYIKINKNKGKLYEIHICIDENKVFYWNSIEDIRQRSNFLL